GLDLTRLAKDGDFVFVDGLTELFATDAPTTPTASASASAGTIAATASASVTSKSQILPVRGPSRPPSTALRPAPPPAASTSQSSPSARGGDAVKLRWTTGRLDQALARLQQQIDGAIATLKATKTDEAHGSEVLLIVDHPDLLLATAEAEYTGSAELCDAIGELREAAHATLVTLFADSPLIHAPDRTPLSTSSASFLASMAYQADVLLQLRCLETGFAKDVSGVIRISKGGQAAHSARWTASPQTQQGLEEKELLYDLRSDGSVVLFGRGEVH
ncbi:hypothetical protein KEM52_005927, partial [Ascosphaera acerosa]